MFGLVPYKPRGTYFGTILGRFMDSTKEVNKIKTGSTVSGSYPLRKDGPRPVEALTPKERKRRNTRVSKAKY